MCELCREQSVAFQRDWADSSEMRENTALSSSVEAKGGVRCEGALTHSAVITWIAGLVTYFRPWQSKLIKNCIKITLILNTVNFDH